MGIVDSRDKNRSIEIRTSAIMDFSEGDEDGELGKREDWLKVLSLMVGHPQGTTDV